MKNNSTDNIPRKTADHISAEAYVWFEESWQHEKISHTHKHYQLTYVEEGYQYFHIDQKIYFVPQHHIMLDSISDATSNNI